jgi:hypothetical protein
VRQRHVLPAAAVLALIAGCGGDDEKPAAKRGAPAPSPKARKVIKLTGFSSPTKNIGCFIARDGVRCDIRERSWKPPHPHRACELDFGQGITLTPGDMPSFVCAGDTALGSKSTLAYGKAIQAGVLRCDSKPTGMTCRDTKTGRGFTLSRQIYKLF